MKTDHSELLVLLKEFQKLCKKHELTYFAAGGTLLGAVRHQGFIPWDDDVDLLMPVDDYLHFLQLSDFDPCFVIQCDQNDEKYPHLFANFCDTRVPFNMGGTYGPWGIFLDIFPLIPSKPNRWDTIFIFNIVKIMNYAMQTKVGWGRFVPYKNPVAVIGQAFMRMLPITWLKWLRLMAVRYLYEDDSGSCCAPGSSMRAEKDIYLQEWFREGIELPFEDTTIVAPCGYEDYLRQHYGNYHKLPPQEERRPHHKQ